MTHAPHAQDDAPNPDPPSIPLGQRLFDNYFLLLIAGIVVMALLYTGWGLWEVLTLDASPLP